MLTLSDQGALAASLTGAQLLVLRRPPSLGALRAAQVSCSLATTPMRRAVQVLASPWTPVLAPGGWPKPSSPGRQLPAPRLWGEGKRPPIDVWGTVDRRDSTESWGPGSHRIGGPQAHEVMSLRM